MNVHPPEPPFQASPLRGRRSVGCGRGGSDPSGWAEPGRVAWAGARLLEGARTAPHAEGLPVRRALDRRAARAALGRAVRLLGQAESGRPGFAFSLSHRDGHGLAAVAAAGCRVGADLERARAVAPGETRWFLTPRERNEAARADGDPTRLWVLKEAAWKLLRLGREVPFLELELGLDAGGRLGSLTTGGRALPVSAAEWRPWPGYLAAAVWSAGEERLS